MPDTKHADRDIALFVLAAVAASIAISALLWLAPVIGNSYTFRNSMFLVPALSVMVAAVGVGWRRKFGFVALTFALFVILDYAGARLGLQDMALDIEHFGAQAWPSVVTVGYQVFIAAYPIVVLIMFVGPRPSVLWTRPPKAASVPARRKK